MDILSFCAATRKMDRICLCTTPPGMDTLSLCTARRAMDIYVIDCRHEMSKGSVVGNNREYLDWISVKSHDTEMELVLTRIGSIDLAVVVCL